MKSLIRSAPIEIESSFNISCRLVHSFFVLLFAFSLVKDCKNKRKKDLSHCILNWSAGKKKPISAIFETQQSIPTYAGIPNKGF
jgi:hypothetical protein